MADDLDLSEQATVILDGSGNGSAKITPGQPGAPGSGVGAGRNSGLKWNVIGVFVSVATNIKEAGATCYISRGIFSQSPGDIQGQTLVGSTGDSCTVNQTLRPGDWVSVKWAGGDAGQLATMRVYGSITTPGA